jgi:alpha-beta hydrolase superfamily lysophospholipase
MRARQFVFASDGLQLAAEIVEPDDPSWTVVLCHGIPGSRPDPADPGYAGFARTLAAHGVAAAWFNFRGCRDAPGDFSMAGWVTDLNAALDAVVPAADAPVALVGSSAGGAAAIAVAAERDDVAAVATLASPAAFEGLTADPATTAHHFRNLGIIRDPAFPPDVDSWAAEFATLAPISFIGGIAPRPLLICHGDADTVVPYEHSEMLFEKAGEPKELVRIPGGGHQLRHDARAVDALTDWFERIPRPARG